MFAEEGAHDRGYGGRLSIGPLHFGGVVSSIYGIVKLGHPGGHQGHLHGAHHEIKFTHVSVIDAILLGDKTVRDIFCQGEVTDMGSGVSPPENTPQDNVACFMCGMPFGMGGGVPSRGGVWVILQ